MASAAFEGVVLALHIAAGFASLFAGAVALLTEKGGRRHRRAGRVFVYSMGFVAASALLLYALDRTFSRLFLGMIAVFSYYFVFSGYRVLGRKRPDDGPGTADWVAVGLLGAAGVGLLGLGALLALDGEEFAPVLLVFGGIATAFGVADVRTFRSAAADPRAWFFQHLARMIGGYVAAVTAFSTVNFGFLPVVARWLWPTAVGVPAIVLLIRRYRTESAGGRPSGG